MLPVIVAGILIVKGLMLCDMTKSEMTAADLKSYLDALRFAKYAGLREWLQHEIDQTAKTFVAIHTALALLEISAGKLEQKAALPEPTMTVPSFGPAEIGGEKQLGLIPESRCKIAHMIITDGAALQEQDPKINPLYQNIALVKPKNVKGPALKVYLKEFEAMSDTEVKDWLATCQGAQGTTQRTPTLQSGQQMAVGVSPVASTVNSSASPATSRATRTI